MTDTTPRPTLLRGIWWLCSKRYRRFGTPKRAERTIAQEAEQNGITRAQAFAMIWADMPEHWRPWIAKYRQPAIQRNEGYAPENPS